jgi:hypothetical protein
MRGALPQQWPVILSLKGKGTRAVIDRPQSWPNQASNGRCSQDIDHKIPILESLSVYLTPLSPQPRPPISKDISLGKAPHNITMTGKRKHFPEDDFVPSEEETYHVSRNKRIRQQPPRKDLRRPHGSSQDLSKASRTGTPSLRTHARSPKP